jgi:hypothetical protein
MQPFPLPTILFAVTRSASRTCPALLFCRCCPEAAATTGASDVDDDICHGAIGSNLSQRGRICDRGLVMEWCVGSSSWFRPGASIPKRPSPRASSRWRVQPSRLQRNRTFRSHALRIPGSKVGSERISTTCHNDRQAPQDHVEASTSAGGKRVRSQTSQPLMIAHGLIRAGVCTNPKVLELIEATTATSTRRSDLDQFLAWRQCLSLNY